MNGIQRMLAATALIVGFAQAAEAANLFTPPSQSGDGTQIVCAITNVGTKPVEVSAKVLNFGNGSDATVGQTCPKSPATLTPGASCVAFGSISGTHPGYCRFGAQGGKVRGVLLIMDTMGYVTSSVPATKQ